LEDARRRLRSRRNAAQIGACFESVHAASALLHRIKHASDVPRAQLGVLIRVLIFAVALAEEIFGESDNGPIHGCHYRHDACYRGHDVLGRVDDVRRRFHGQELQHTAYVGTRGISGTHAVAAVRRHSIALTQFIRLRCGLEEPRAI
jgi:hypothetical protein